MSINSAAGTIESLDQFEGESGEAQRWTQEITAAEQELQKFHTASRKINKRYLDERKSRDSGESKLNIFWSNTSLVQAMMFGNTPAVDVSRRFGDANDDVARVAGEIMERLLNTDIESDNDSFSESVDLALQDRLIVGLGQARVRYEADFDCVEVPPVLGPDGTEIAPGYSHEKKIHEDCAVDYVHWEDFLWSPCRVWAECRWVAFRAYLTKDDASSRFGKKKAAVLSYGAKNTARVATAGMQADPWQRAEVWEIWDKDSDTVVWWAKGQDELLDKKRDPLELDGFWPCPKPFVANVTTSKFVPKADFAMTQDQYHEIDTLTTRINIIQEAIKVVGVYDSSATGVQRMMQEGVNNELIPVDSWALFAERGGIKGAVDWVPIDQAVNALQALREHRNGVVETLDQLTGMSDIVRGQATTGPAKTATEQSIKGRFSSARMQDLQGKTEEFAADLQRLKAEIITKHFDPGTIYQRSNIQYTTDADLAGPAIALLSGSFTEYRVQIQSGAMAMSDYAAMQAERTNYLKGLSGFLTAAAPMAAQQPESLPYLLEMLKWGMAGYRGSNQIEGVLDKAIQAAQDKLKNPPQGGEGKPDPALEKEKLKAQTESAKAQGRMQEIAAKAQAESAKIWQETQARLQEVQAESMASSKQEQEQAYWAVQEEQQKAEIKRRESTLKGVI